MSFFNFSNPSNTCSAPPEAPVPRCALKSQCHSIFTIEGNNYKGEFSEFCLGGHQGHGLGHAVRADRRPVWGGRRGRLLPVAWVGSENSVP